MSETTWQKRASHVGGILPKNSLHSAVLRWAERHAKSGPWAVAFSGGADSLALLLALWAHWPERRKRIVALHFNHRLRGRESTADVAFCRRVCASLGIRIRVGEWKKARPGASEAEARAARHDFFGRQLRSLGTSALWLAHQQDDIAESIFMRLARGSGTGGLAAPRPVQIMAVGKTHLRPLLTVKKTDLLAALRSANANWREDSSNAGPTHFRNRVRRSVLPAWARAAGRDALAGAALSRERLEEDDAALDIWLGELQPLTKAGRLDLRRLIGRPRALFRRALHRWLLDQPVQTHLSRQGFDLLLAAIERAKPTRFSLGREIDAVIWDGRLRCEIRRKPARRSKKIIPFSQRPRI